MTTKNSPTRVLRQQAEKIASVLKAAERGEKIDARFAQKIEEARTKEVFKVGIVMDDKVITIEMPWAKIKDTDEAALIEYLLDLMREARNTSH